MKTLGSLFAGIGGFDLGFENAGWRTSWQVERNPIHRLVLADRFPAARQYDDVCTVGSGNLAAVDCITAGFPCQDISIMGNARKGGQPGLAGARSGLFWEVARILGEIQPPWVVLENVPALLSSNDGRDFAAVVNALAERGYLGFWRVLNAVHFGVPQNRCRLFVVAGLGRYPSFDFLADAASVDVLSTTLAAGEVARGADAGPLGTLTARKVSTQINLGCEVLVAEEDGWGAMVERARSAALHGLSRGLDDTHHYQGYAAGNAVVPAIAQWIAEIIDRS